MNKEYQSPGILPLHYDFAAAPQLDRTDAFMTLSRKDVLGIVQSALDEIAPQHPELTAVKREVLQEVADGRLAHALRSAIVGAGKTCCGCCD